ncbi:hypothetical protein JCM8547_001837 [Rhodosporidiobolus lusitaniae]
MTNDKTPRSAFVPRLHQLLSAEEHPDWLHWLNNDTFAITSIDTNARIALQPQWDFRSLSSFIRQLSYYSFKRLSDRRRSAERRSSVASYIVFTHPSGNFVRDDPSKAALIPRKLRARKPSTRKRKNSAASSTGQGDLAGRSPSPGDGELYEMYPNDEAKPNEVHLDLQSYQLAPWNATQGRTIRSPERIAQEQPPMQLHLLNAPMAGASSFPASSYPSPSSAPASSVFFPSSSYYPPPSLAQRPQHEQPVYYYPSAPTAAQGTNSPFASYAANELPPLRAVAAGLVVPPSPPPEQVFHSGSDGHYIEQAHHSHALDHEQTPSPVAHHAQLAGPRPMVPLPSVAQLEPQHFYPPSPPKHHNAYFAESHPHAHHYSPYHAQDSAKSAFYHLSGQDGMDYGAHSVAAHA